MLHITLPRPLTLAVLLVALGAAPALPAYTNPLITNTRDVDCSRFNGMYHLIEPGGGSTNGGFYKYRSSTDLVHWSAVTNIFQRTAGNELWEGNLYQHTDGTVYLYYTNVDSSGTATIGVASAPSPTGPYTDHGALVTGGRIDPCVFRDSDGTLWLYYKNDNSSPTWQKNIWVQKLSDPTTKYAGYSAKLLISPAAGTWEDNGYVSVEGPALLKFSGKYFLFYAGGPYGQKTYAIGYAYAAAPDGPFTKYSGNPIMSNTESSDCYSIGAPSIVGDYSVNAQWMVYRQRVDATTGSARQLTIDAIDVSKAASNIINAKATSGKDMASPIPLDTPGSSLYINTFWAANSNGWGVDSGTWSVILDGSYVYKQSASSGVSHVGNTSWTDYSAQVQVKPLTLGSGTISLSTRLQPDASGNPDIKNRYIASLSASAITLKKEVGGTQTNLTTTVLAPFSLGTGAWRTVTFTVSGSSLQVSVDGTPIVSATDSTFGSGAIALSTSGGATAEFTNVVVYH